MRSPRPRPALLPASPLRPRARARPASARAPEPGSSEAPSGPRRPPRASRPPPLPFAPTPALLLRASRLKNNSGGAASSALRHCTGGTRTRRPRSRAEPRAQRAGRQRGQQTEHRAPRTSPPGGSPAPSCLRGPQVSTQRRERPGWATFGDWGLWPPRCVAGGWAGGAGGGRSAGGSRPGASAPQPSSSEARQRRAGLGLGRESGPRSLAGTVRTPRPSLSGIRE